MKITLNRAAGKIDITTPRNQVSDELLGSQVE